MTTDGHVDRSTVGAVAVVRLNRPERRNALSAVLLADLRSRLAECDADEEVRAVVLTGADPAFCAGLDFDEVVAGGTLLRPGDGRPWPELAKPVIGAVNGPAMTGGLEVALACDFLVASERAVFADTHATIGLVPFWGMTARLPSAVGVRRAIEMSLTAEPVDARQALEWGLVNRVVPHARLLDEALAIATRVASADRTAARSLLAAYRAWSGDGPEARRAELAVAERFFGAGFDPSGLEARRREILARSRALRREPGGPEGSPGDP